MSSLTIKNLDFQYMPSWFVLAVLIKKIQYIDSAYEYYYFNNSLLHYFTHLLW